METVTKEQMVRAYNLNPKEFNYGDLVYFVGFRSQDNTFKNLVYNSHLANERVVLWGTVLDHYCSEIAIARYAPIDVRTINGTPAIDFKTPTKWQKLPKSWSYDTKLFEEKYDNIPKEMYERFGDYYKSVLNLYWSSIVGRLTDNEILDAIHLGLFVRPSKVENARFKAEITKEGWRIVRDYRDLRSDSDYCTIPYFRVYKTRKEAQKELDDYRAELKRQASLSDLEWSIEQIDHTLNHWQALYHILDEDKKKVRDRLLALDDVEEIEVRLAAGHIEWKYDRNRRWKRIDPE